MKVITGGVVMAGLGLATMLGGCGTIGKTSLPESVTLELPDGSIVEVEQGAGAPSLANSTWQFFQTNSSGQSLPFVTISFGANGNLERFDENTIASEIFGDTILFDGARHNTTQKGLQYAAATFGAETDDATGFTFEGRLSAFAGGIQAANATASAVATYDPDDPDVVLGTFSFSTRVTISSIPNGDTDVAFDFIGHRVVAE